MCKVMLISRHSFASFMVSDNYFYLFEIMNVKITFPEDKKGFKIR